MTPDVDPKSWRVVVHRWDVRAPLPEPLVAEVRRAHHLRNDLVQVEREHAEAVARVWAEHPEVAETEVAVDEADAGVEAARKALAEAKKLSGAAKAPAELTAALRSARKAKRDATARRREAKSAAYAAMKPAMVAARSERKAKIKALYRAWMDRGLYWATFNHVRDHHETAVRQIAARRKAGKSADLRFARWTGEGTIAVQLQRQAGEPQRTPGVLADPEGPWRNVARLVDYPTADEQQAMSKADWRRHARRGVTQLVLRYGSGDHADWATLPVAIGRPIPNDADIVGIQLTRRLIAGKERATVAVTMRLPLVAPQTGQLVAMHTGWRSMPDGTIRVAVVDGCSEPPVELIDQGIVRWWSTWGEIRVPARWVDEDRRLAAIAAQRDSNHNQMKARLIDHLDGVSEPVLVTWGDGADAERLEPHHVKLWRSPRRLAQLATRARQGHVTGLRAEIRTDLDAWRRQDHHLWQWHAHATDQLVARRKDFWRKAANWIVSSAGGVVTDEWAIPALTARPDITEDRDWQADHARRNARLASPGLLRAQLARAAGQRGIEILKRPTETRAHAHCGGLLNLDQLERSVLAECAACGTTVDQDHNALTQMRAPR